MKVQVLTLFPELIEQAIQYGLMGQAVKKKLLEVSALNPRDFAEGVHKAVDDRPYGGGDGMVMSYLPLAKGLQSLGISVKSERPPGNSPQVIYLSPQGKTLTPQKSQELSQANFVLVCGRYGGVDQRWINDYVDEELSIGDYVLNGGELAALVVIEAAMRFIPGALGHGESAEKDSFSKPRLEAPQYTRPESISGQVVPAILRSGHHQKQKEWSEKVSLLVTGQKRPDLESWQQLSQKQKAELREFLRSLTDNEKRTLGLDADVHQKLFGEDV